MQDGRIAQAGKFQDLLQQNVGFEALVGAHSQALESILNAESSSRLSSISPECKSQSTTDQFGSINKQESKHDLSQDSAQKGRLTQEEEREKGAIGKKVYWAYMTAVKGGALIPVIVLVQLLFQLLQVWIVYQWGSATSNTRELEKGKNSQLSLVATHGFVASSSNLFLNIVCTALNWSSDL